MKRLLVSIVAVVFWMVAASTAFAQPDCEVADTSGDITVHVLSCDNDTTYLVDSDGKAVYYFVPNGSAHYKIAELWPEYSRDWIQAWSPILVEDVADVTTGSNLDADHFGATPNPRTDGEGTFHVRWGGENTCLGDGACGADGGQENIVHFWGLYTFEDDVPLEEYVELGMNPPGLVEGLWQWIKDPSAGAPMPVNEALLQDIHALSGPGGGSGAKDIGGP